MMGNFALIGETLAPGASAGVRGSNLSEEEFKIASAEFQNAF